MVLLFHFFDKALTSRERFLLQTDARLLVVLAFFYLRQDAGFFARLFEATERLFETFVVTKSNQCQENHLPFNKLGRMPCMWSDQTTLPKI